MLKSNLLSTSIFHTANTTGYQMLNNTATTTTTTTTALNIVTLNQSDVSINDEYRNWTAYTNDDMISKFTADMITFAIECVIFPLLTVFGVSGNILSLIVLMQKRLFNATNVLLTGLAIADILFLVACFIRKLTCVLETFGPAFAKWHLFHRYTTFLCITISFSRISCILVVAISVERFIAVAFPLRMQNMISKFKMTVVVILIYMFTLAVCLPFAFQMTVVEINNTVYPALSNFYKDNEQFLSLYNRYLTVIALRWIPGIMIIIFNGMVIVKLRQRSAFMDDFRSQSAREDWNTEQRRITKMLLSVAVVFIICLLPGDALIVIEEIHKNFNSRGKFRNSYKVFSDISQLFEMINSSLNFFIYFAFNRKFSSAFKDLFCRCFRRNTVAESSRRT